MKYIIAIGIFIGIYMILICNVIRDTQLTEKDKIQIEVVKLCKPGAAFNINGINCNK